jgi:hypothetical protein
VDGLRGLKPAGIVGAATILTAFGLATLYVIGAYMKITELQGAGIRVQDALPLVPIEQLLARGIATSGVSVLVAASLGIPVLVLALAHSRGGKEPRTGKEWAAIGAALAWLCGFGFGLLFLRLELMAAAAVAAITVIVALRLGGNPVTALGFALVLALLAVAIHSWYFPQPLPAVVLTTTDGETHQGNLVVIANETWYVNQGGGTIRAFQASDLDAAYLRTRARSVIRGPGVVFTGTTVQGPTVTEYTTTTVTETE